MNSIALIAFTEKGCALAQRIADALGSYAAYAGIACAASGPARFAAAFDMDAYESLQSWTAREFARADALVFVGASGIAVRAIAPHVKDKMADPAVVSVDEAGRFVVPLLSGHVGGANALARTVAAVTGGCAAISTATDVNGLFAVDEWAANNNLAIAERAVAKEIAAALLEGRTVGFSRALGFDMAGDLPDGVVRGPAPLGFTVALGCDATPFERTLHLVPRIVTVGVGCRKGADPNTLRQAVDSVLAQMRISPLAVADMVSIDVKRDEPAILQLAAERGWDVHFHTASELAAVPGDFSGSDFVLRTVGVDNVCERAALVRGGVLVVGKQAREGTTVALSIDEGKIGTSVRMDAGVIDRLSEQMGR